MIGGGGFDQPSPTISSGFLWSMNALLSVSLWGGWAGGVVSCVRWFLGLGGCALRTVWRRCVVQWTCGCFYTFSYFFYWTYHSVPCCLCLFFVCLFIYQLCAVATVAVSYMTYLGDYWMTFTITSHRSLVGFSWLVKSDYSSSMKAVLCYSHVTGFCLWNILGLHSFCSVYPTKALKKDI